jgi:hypothetical protein
MAPPLGPGGARIQFTYKLKLNERVRAKCSRHPATIQRNTTLADGLRAHHFRFVRHSGATPTLGGSRIPSRTINDEKPISGTNPNVSSHLVPHGQL